VGDVHGCLDELRELLGKLGHLDSKPEGDRRRIVFVGDLIDRGPDSLGVLKLAMQLQEQGRAVVVMGNHDWKLYRKLLGRRVQMGHGLYETWQQVIREPGRVHRQLKQFLERLTSHIILDQERLIVAHAGIKPEYFNKTHREAHEFGLFGETTGEEDEHGFPVRCDWAQHYHGETLIVYGHTPVVEPRWVNRTVNVDTGCVFGGKLTALRFPEMETVSVPARAEYQVPSFRFLEGGIGAPLVDCGEN
jgi:protein phosphatase